MDHGFDGDLHISETLIIPSHELTERFVRASGPGGQKVNKVASAVQLRWNITASFLPGAVKTRIRRLWASRISGQGDIIIEASEHRSQALNRVAARKRLRDMIRKALIKPKRRIATKPGRAVVQRRLNKKKRRATVKAGRAKVKDLD